MLDFPVKYLGVDLNTVEGAGNGKRKGVLLEEFDFGRSQGRGYTEPRAQDDGLDASDVFMGARYVNLTGVVFGENEGDLHDRLQGVRTALTPTVAYDKDKTDYGYNPLEFVVPTEKRDDFPLGYRQMEVRARPLGQPQFTIRRDSGEAPGVGGNSKGGGIMWRSTLECKDPRMYVRPPVLVPFLAGTPTGGSPLANRGDYPAPVDIMLVTGQVSVAASKVEIDIGQSNMTILMDTVGPPVTHFPAGTIFRYSSAINVLTVQAPGDAIDTLRMDLLVWRNNTTRPFVPPSNPADSTYAVRLTSMTLANGTHLLYSESFA